MNYSAATELETLRGLFKEITGRDDYFSPYTVTLKDEIKEFKEGYRNLDETISNFENKIYQKNKEIERLQSLLDKRCSKEPQIIEKEVVKIVEKETPKDNRPIRRGSKIYNKFRLNVLKRDEVCQCCGATENLHVHHLSSFKLHNSRGADTDNGIVLCKECHGQYHSIYGKGHKNNPVNFAKFLREYGRAMQVNLDYNVDSDNIFLQMFGGK